MNSIVNEVLKDYLDSDNKIKIPKKFSRVKIDVGTSINAPNSENWLDGETDLCVFGFEPNPFNVEHVKTCPEKIWPVHLNTDRVNDTFFMVETALTDKEPQIMKFFCTAEDSGCSSLYRPTSFALREEVEVSSIQLRHFFELFPWERIPYIEHLKIDAQNSDFDIIKGAGDYLKKVMFISVECSTGTQYENPFRSSDMKKYIEDQGFHCFNWQSNGNFYNKRFENLLDEVSFVFLEPN